MKKDKMPEIRIRRKSKLNLRIPGGWTYYTPVVEADPQTYEIYTVPFLREKPGNVQWASEQVSNLVQTAFDNEWRKRLRNAVHYWATRYAKMYPHLVNADGTLKGFQPSRIQTIFVPGDRSGRRGKLIGSQLLLEMAQNAE